MTKFFETQGYKPLSYKVASASSGKNLNIHGRLSVSGRGNGAVFLDDVNGKDVFAPVCTMITERDVENDGEQDQDHDEVAELEQTIQKITLWEEQDIPERYLEENVFPILLSGIEKLMKRVKKEMVDEVLATIASYGARNSESRATTSDGNMYTKEVNALEAKFGVKKVEEVRSTDSQVQQPPVQTEISDSNSKSQDMLLEQPNQAPQPQPQPQQSAPAQPQIPRISMADKMIKVNDLDPINWLAGYLYRHNPRRQRAATPKMVINEAL